MRTSWIDCVVADAVRRTRHLIVWRTSACGRRWVAIHICYSNYDDVCHDKRVQLLPTKRNDNLVGFIYRGGGSGWRVSRTDLQDSEKHRQLMRSYVGCWPNDAVSHARPNDTLEDRRPTDRPSSDCLLSDRCGRIWAMRPVNYYRTGMLRTVSILCCVRRHRRFASRGLHQWFWSHVPACLQIAIKLLFQFHLCD